MNDTDTYTPALKVGDIIVAKPGTADFILSEGTAGVVRELRDHKPYSSNTSNNLVEWQSSEDILLSFHPEDVIPLGVQIKSVPGAS